MAERILVPYDGSALSARALERVATKHPDDEVHALYVIDPVGGVYEGEAHGLVDGEQWYENAKSVAESALADANALAADHGIELTTAHEVGNPHRVILDYVDEHDVDHVVMGSHGRSGVSRLLLGSTAERVMRQSPVPVTVVR
ncbi:universal stress protein [Halorarius litoreus]|uniref:universal stress protein n=1 Tax=Halorarius litoreus TaxID=2962676 RepID=UPI0020CD5919|nr:universal stress protein [Halorarius litoreus]